jgi:hypothetical protein
LFIVPPIGLIASFSTAFAVSHIWRRITFAASPLENEDEWDPGGQIRTLQAPTATCWLLLAVLSGTAAEGRLAQFQM